MLVCLCGLSEINFAQLRFKVRNRGLRYANLLGGGTRLLELLGLLLAVREYARPLLEAARATQDEIQVLILLIDDLVLLGCAHQG